MDSSVFFKFNLPESDDKVDIDDINDNFQKMDQVLLAGLCRKEMSSNSMGDGTQIGSEKAWPPFLEIKNESDSAIVVEDRNYGDMNIKYEIEAGKTYRHSIGGLYPLNFLVEDGKNAKFSWFVSTQEYIASLESRIASLENK